jgi:hypothetical protein
MNITFMGLLLMPCLAAKACSASVFTLRKRTLGWRSAAFRSNVGDLTLHSSHHGAQKSTTTGISSFCTCFCKLYSETDIAQPVKIAFWHRPRLALPAGFAFGTRFATSQLGQTMSLAIPSAIEFPSLLAA